MLDDQEKKNDLNQEEIAKLRNAVLNRLQTPEDSQPSITKKNEEPTINHSEKLKPSVKRSNLPKLFLKFSILVVLILFSLQTWAYLFTPQDIIFKSITRIIPIPIALVNFQPIYYSDWLNQINSLNHYYVFLQNSNSQKIEIPDQRILKEKLFDRLIEQKLIKQLTMSYNVDVTADELDQETLNIINKAGGMENLKQQLATSYAWSIKDFQNNILMPLLAKNNLNLYLLEQPENNEARILIEKIYSDLNSGQDTFESLAQQYSNDSSASQGGDIGYFNKGEIILPIQKEIFELLPGQTSHIIKTNLGFHIFKVTEKLNDSSNQPNRIRLSQILVATKDFQGRLENFKEESKIIKLIKI
ncbi:MAG: peptidylprolyl isomerase [Candidatus Buchananbacteria bacterium]